MIIVLNNRITKIYNYTENESNLLLTSVFLTKNGLFLPIFLMMITFDIEKIFHFCFILKVIRLKV